MSAQFREKGDRLQMRRRPGPTILTSLPYDILCHIVSDLIAKDSRLPIRRQAPLNISQTCRKLRDFALSVPRFWAHLDSISTPRTAPFRIQIAKLWLERSQRAPLVLRLRCFKGDKDGDTMWNLDAWDLVKFHRLLVKKQACWKVIEIRQSYGYLFRDSIEPTSLTDLSQLTHWWLEDDFPFDMEDRLSQEIRPLFLLPPAILQRQPLAPRLAILRINGIDGEHQPARGLLIMLSQCPCLKRLYLHFKKGAHGSLPLDCPRVVLAGLLSLSVKGAFGIDTLAFLRCMRTPKLTELVFGAATQLAMAAMAREVPPFLKRSTKGVKHATLGARKNGFWVSAQQLRKLLEALPNVTHMRWGFEARSSLIHLLTVADGSYFVPHLERIRLVVGATTGPNDVLSMLLTRRDGGRGLFVELWTAEWGVDDQIDFLNNMPVVQALCDGTMTFEKRRAKIDDKYGYDRSTSALV